MAFNPNIPGYSTQGKSFSRTAAFPLESYEIWTDYDALVAYAANTDPAKDPSYIGQKVTYIDVENRKVVHYGIEIDGTLKEIGVAPIGDDKSIDVDENGKVSIHGFDALTNEHIGYLPRIKKVVDKEANPGYVSDSKSETADTILTLRVSLPKHALIDKVTLSAMSVSTGNPALFDPSTYKYTFSNGTVNFMLTGFNAGEYNNFSATVDYTYVDPQQATPEESHLEIEWAPVSAIVEGDTNTITQVAGKIGDVSFVNHVHDESTDTHTYTIDLSPVTDRLDVLEGGADEEGSVKYIVASAVGELENNLQDGAVVVAKASEAENATKLGGKAASEYVEKTAYDKYVDETEQTLVDLGEALEDYKEELNTEIGKKLDQTTYDEDKATFATKTEVGDAVEEINGEIATKASDDELQELKARVDAFLTGAGTEAALDSLKELIDYIDAHDAANLAADIEKLEKKVVLGTYMDGEEEKEYATVKAYVEAAIAALKIGDYAKAADLTALAGRVGTLEGKVDVEKVSTAISVAAGAAEEAAKSYATDLNEDLEIRIESLEDGRNDYQAADTELQTALESKIATAKGEAISDADGKLNAYKGEVTTTLTNYYNKTEIDGKVGTINTAIENEGKAREALATEVANDKQALVDYKAEMVTALGNKVDAGTIAHTSENVEEGVTRNGTTLNIVVDAYKKAETYTKGEVDNAITKKIQDVTGGENASAVKLALNDYIKANDTEIYGAAKVAEWTVDGVYTPDYTKDSRLDSLKGQADGNARDILALQNTVNGTADNEYKDGLAVRLAALEEEVGVVTESRIDSLVGTVGEHSTAIGNNTADITTLKTTTIPGLQVAINGKVAQGDFDALNAKVDTGDKKVSEYVAEAIAGKADDTAIKALIKAEEDRAKGEETRIEGLVTAEAGRAAGEEARIEGLVTAEAQRADTEEKRIVGLIEAEVARADNAEKANKALIDGLDAAVKANAGEITRVDNVLKAALENEGDGLDSIKELADWINKHGTDAANMTKAIEKNATDIANIYTPASGEKEASGLLVEEVARIDGVLAGHKTAIETTLPGAITKALEDAKKYADDQDVITLAAAKKYTDDTMVKADGVTIENKEGTFGVKAISTDLLVQGDQELILNGGNAALN